MDVVLKRSTDGGRNWTKSYRYDEVGFTVVPFADICTLLPPTPTKGSTK